MSFISSHPVSYLDNRMFRVDKNKVRTNPNGHSLVLLFVADVVVVVAAAVDVAKDKVNE